MFPAVTKENRKIVEHKWDHPSNVIDQKSIKLNFKGLMNFKAMF
jgi:hypothetical protein